MCRDLVAVWDAKEAMVDPQTAVCQQRGPDGAVTRQCRFFDECSYQKQRSSRADIWFSAHEMVFEKKPAAMGVPAFLMIDETVWQDGLIGADGNPIRLTVDTLDREDVIARDPAGTTRLWFLRRRLFDMLATIPDGPLSRAAVAATGITSQSAAEARTLEWRLRADPGILIPTWIQPTGKCAIMAAAINKTISRLSLVWEAIEDLMRPDGPDASGWVKIEWRDTPAGRIGNSTSRVVRMSRRGLRFQRSLLTPRCNRNHCASIGRN